MKRLLKITCILLCLLLVLSGASCKKADKAGGSHAASSGASKDNVSGETSQSGSSDTQTQDGSSGASSRASSRSSVGGNSSLTSSQYKELIKTDPTLTVNQNPNGWKAVPLINEEQIKAGLAGGEGGQVILSVTSAPSDSKIAFFTTDVGGVYKSTDGGISWFPVTDGMRACGGNAVVCDPYNAERVCVVGTNSYVSPKAAHGLYFSKNGGSKWEIKVQASVGGYRDYRTSIAFDRTSYSASLKGCSTIYWARAGEEFGSKKSEPYSALYKSTDGGANWTVVNTSSYIGISDICVDPKNGYVYAGSTGGLYRSKDGGKSFTSIASDSIGTIALVGAADETIKLYYASNKGLFLSVDHGNTFNRISKLSFLADVPKFLSVSPVEQCNMVIQDSSSKLKELYYSNDFGSTWTKSDMGFAGSRKCVNGFITYLENDRPSAWSATDANTLISVGGGFMIRSTDGGKTFKWSNSGNNGSCSTRYIFNNLNNKLVLATNQDYNGGFSVDGGKTWKYVNWQQADWGGQTYGGYIFDAKNMFVGVKVSGKNVPCYTSSGGNNVTILTSKTLSTTASLGSPKNKNVAFLGQYRVEFNGTQLTRYDFTEMSGCIGVYDYDPDTNTLYGRGENSTVVKSTDDGKTWTTVGTSPKAVKGLVYNQKDDKLFVLVTDKLYSMNPSTGATSEVSSLPTKDCSDWSSYGFQFKAIAIDHKNPDIMYVGNSRDIYLSDIAVLATTDGGKTWISMSSDEYKDEHGTMPVRAVDSLTVDRTDGSVYALGGCRGIWKHKGLRK